MKTVDLSGRPFHFIGIGGIGMSALAYILAKRRISVSGSDLRSSSITERLRSLGVHIFNRQEAANLTLFSKVAQSVYEPASAAVIGSIVEEQPNNIPYLNKSFQQNNLPQVICSTAISPTNLEYQAAIELGCPIFHRSDLLAALISDCRSIAVSGTHGKTTTSSLIAYMLLLTGLDPTIIVGGEVDAWQGNARVGKSNYLVAEADESDGSLIKHQPSIGVVTNIELDHPDHYQSIEEVVKIFQIFAQQCDTLIGCLDDPIICQNLQLEMSYSLNPDSGADYILKNPLYHAQGSQGEVWERGTYLGNLQLQLLGKHNLSNALGAVAVGRKLGLDFTVIAKALASFQGTKRRFEKRGEVNEIIFIDDYAHHPSEINATLAAARVRVQEDDRLQRVVAIFQPHRYSRTQAFMTEFATAFGDADAVVVTDIYSAGEENRRGINGKALAEAIAVNHPQVHYHSSLASLASFLQQEILQPGDLALFLGAGNLNQVIPQAIALY